MITVELTAAIDATGTTEVEYFSDDRLITESTDTPASTAFETRIIDPGSLGRHAYSDGRTGGATKLETGEIVLANVDGGLDAWRSYSFDARDCVIRSGNAGDAYPSAWTTLLSGTVESIELTFEKVIVRLKDKQFTLEKPACPNTYAGSNSLPAGVEGVAGDIKGRRKPKLYGKAYNFSPPLVNTSNLVYQLSDATMQSIEAVYDQGVALTAGVATRLTPMAAGVTSVTFTAVAATDILTTGSAHGYTTADPVTMATTNTLPAPLASTIYYYARSTGASTLTLHPTAADASANTNIVNITDTGTGTHNISNNRTLAGKYDWAFDATGSYMRLGTSPTGQITVDASHGAAAANRTVAQLLKQLALDAGVASGDISSADVTALDTADSSVVGVYLDNDITFLAAMDEIANSVGAGFGFDSLGDLRMWQLTSDSASADVTLYDYDLLSLERRPPRDNARPAWRVTVQHSRYYTVQTTDLAGAVTVVRRGELANEYRGEKDEDSAIKTQWLLAQELMFITRLTASADASAEATRLLTMYKVQTHNYEVTVSMDIVIDNALQIMDVARLIYSRFGMSAGRYFRIIGIEFQLAKWQARLSLVGWGAGGLGA